MSSNMNSPSPRKRGRARHRNSGVEERERLHQQASLLALEHRCLACHKEAPSEPCHFPTHRGMGGGKASWFVTEWVPLCRRCHDILDGRAGVSKKFAAEKATIIMLINNALSRKLWPPQQETP